MGRLGGLVRHRHRIIQVHPDFFDDDLLLGLEVVDPQGRSQDVRQDVEGLRKVFGQAGHVVERVFFGRLRIVLGTHAIEVVVDGHRVAPIRSLERHVLEEMRYAGHARLDSSRLPALTINPAATE